MSNNNNTSRLFAIRFLYTLIEKGQSTLTSSAFSDDSFENKIEDFINSYREPDQENPYSEISEEQIFRAKQIIAYVKDSFDDLNETISNQLKQGITSLKKMDYSILIVGTSEILNFKVPFQVVANEMVQISKEFSSENSPQFINGVLDGIGRSAKV